jgi:hypothetical protein
LPVLLAAMVNQAAMEKKLQLLSAAMAVHFQVAPFSKMLKSQKVLQLQLPLISLIQVLN